MAQLHCPNCNHLIGELDPAGSKPARSHDVTTRSHINAFLDSPFALGLAPGTMIKSADAYKLYVTWCERTGTVQRLSSPIGFVRACRQYAGFTTHRTSGTRYLVHDSIGAESNDDHESPPQ